MANYTTVDCLSFLTRMLCSNGQIYGGDFAKFCGLLRIYELYLSTRFDRKQKQPNKCRVVKQFSYSILVSTYALAKKYIDIPKD